MKSQRDPEGYFGGFGLHKTCDEAVDPMLIQQSFFLKQRIDTAIDRIRSFCPEDGYYGAFSGGKDSQVIYQLLLMAGVKFDAHFSRTTVDPPEVTRFIRDHYPDVKFHKPATTMWKLIVKKRMPPTRRVRYCCEWLKEVHGHGRVVVTGIRWQESVKRRARKMVEMCYKDSSKVYVNPIIDWTTEEVWDFIISQELPYCSLYDEGFKRIGCVMCPMARYKQRLREAERWPGFFRAYMRAFGKMLEGRERAGLKTDRWKSAEDVMTWWILERDDHQAAERLFSMFE